MCLPTVIISISVTPMVGAMPIVSVFTYCADCFTVSAMPFSDDYSLAAYLVGAVGVPGIVPVVDIPGWRRRRDVDNRLVMDWSSVIVAFVHLVADNISHHAADSCADEQSIDSVVIGPGLC